MIKKNNTYAWTIGESETAATAGVKYVDENDYVDLTVSLGKSDSLNENIKFAASSVKEQDTKGQKNLDETKRYLLVTPKYDGKLSITIAFASGNNNRIYYADMGLNAGEPNLSDYTKETPANRQIAGDGIKTTSATERTIDMTAGHSYIIYTYQQGSSISKLSYKYEGGPVETTEPTTVPTVEPTTVPTVKPTEIPEPTPTSTPDISKLSEITIKSRVVSDNKIDYKLQIEPTANGTLIAAVYDENGMLYRLLSQELDGNSADIEVEIPPAEQSAEVKFMLWDGLDTMKPFSNVLADKYVYQAPAENSN